MVDRKFPLCFLSMPKLMISPPIKSIGNCISKTTVHRSNNKTVRVQCYFEFVKPIGVFQPWADN